MDDLLNFDITTTPGEVAYDVSSEELAILFVLSVISEGYKEEPKYLAYIRDVCNQKSSTQIVIHIVNRHYKRQQESAGRNHPLKRLSDLLDWKEHHEQIGECENKDEYWLICDRDNETFTSEQYDQLLVECKKNNINVIVSNPSFQIWLLLHFTNNLDVFNLSQYTSSSDCIKKGVEPAIKLYYPRYKHGKLNMTIFAPQMRYAIDKSLPYSHDLIKLRENIGTNFRELLIRIESVSGKMIF